MEMIKMTNDLEQILTTYIRNGQFIRAKMFSIAHLIPRTFVNDVAKKTMHTKLQSGELSDAIAMADKYGLYYGSNDETNAAIIATHGALLDEREYSKGATVMEKLKVPVKAAQDKAVDAVKKEFEKKEYDTAFGLVKKYDLAERAEIVQAFSESMNREISAWNYSKVEELLKKDVRFQRSIVRDKAKSHYDIEIKNESFDRAIFLAKSIMDDYALEINARRLKDKMTSTKALVQEVFDHGSEYPLAESYLMLDYSVAINHHTKSEEGYASGGIGMPSKWYIPKDLARDGAPVTKKLYLSVAALEAATGEPIEKIVEGIERRTSLAASVGRGYYGYEWEWEETSPGLCCKDAYAVLYINTEVRKK